MATHHRLLDWTDETRLWRLAVHAAPLKPRPWVNYGRALTIAGDEDAARAAYTQALSVSAGRSRYERAVTELVVGTNLAVLDERHGDYHGAARRLDQVMRHPAWRDSLFPIQRYFVEVVAKCGSPCYGWIS